MRWVLKGYKLDGGCAGWFVMGYAELAELRMPEPGDVISDVEGALCVVKWVRVPTVTLGVSWTWTELE